MQSRRVTPVTTDLLGCLVLANGRPGRVRAVVVTGVTLRLCIEVEVDPGRTAVRWLAVVDAQGVEVLGGRPTAGKRGA
jgi:hypothetical protein